MKSSSTATPTMATTLTQASLEEHVRKISVLSTTSPATRALCKQVISGLQSDVRDSGDPLVDHPEVAMPFVVTLAENNRVPGFVLDYVRIFVSRGIVGSEHFPTIVHAITNGRWGSDSTLKAVQIALLLSKEHSVHGESLIQLLSFLERMCFSGDSKVSVFADVAANQMISYVAERCSQKSELCSTEPSRSDAYSDLILIAKHELAKLQPKCDDRFALRALDATVERLIAADVDSTLHGDIIRLLATSPGDEGVLKIFYRYVCARKRREECCESFSANLKTRSAATTTFISELRNDDFDFLEDAMQAINEYVLSEAAADDKCNLVAAERYCSYLYSMGEKRASEMECAAAFFKAHPISITAARLVLLWSADNNRREVYEEYVAVLFGIDERTCINAMLDTVEFARESWEAVTSRITREGFKIIEEHASVAQWLVDLFRCMKPEQSEEHLRCMVALFKAALSAEGDRADQPTADNLLEIALESTLAANSIESLKAVTADYLRSVDRYDEQALMDCITKFVDKNDGSTSNVQEILEVLADMLKAVSDRFAPGSVQSALKIIGKNIKRGELVKTNLGILQWVAQETSTTDGYSGVLDLIFQLPCVEVIDELNAINILVDIAECLVSVCCAESSDQKEGPDKEAHRYAVFARYFQTILKHMLSESAEVAEASTNQAFSVLRMLCRGGADSTFISVILFNIVYVMRRFGSPVQFLFECADLPELGDNFDRFDIKVDRLATPDLPPPGFGTDKSMLIFLLAARCINTLISPSLGEFCLFYLRVVTKNLSVLGVVMDASTAWVDEYGTTLVRSLRALILNAVKDGVVPNEYVSAYIRTLDTIPLMRCSPSVYRDVIALCHLIGRVEGFSGHLVRFINDSDSISEYALGVIRHIARDSSSHEDITKDYIKIILEKKIEIGRMAVADALAVIDAQSIKNRTECNLLAAILARMGPVKAVEAIEKMTFGVADASRFMVLVFLSCHILVPLLSDRKSESDCSSASFYSDEPACVSDDSCVEIIFGSDGTACGMVGVDRQACSMRDSAPIREAAVANKYMSFLSGVIGRVLRSAKRSGSLAERLSSVAIDRRDCSTLQTSLHYAFSVIRRMTRSDDESVKFGAYNIIFAFRDSEPARGMIEDLVSRRMHVLSQAVVSLERLMNRFDRFELLLLVNKMIEFGDAELVKKNYVSLVNCVCARDRALTRGVRECLLILRERIR